MREETVDSATDKICKIIEEYTASLRAELSKVREERDSLKDISERAVTKCEQLADKVDELTAALAKRTEELTTMRNHVELLLPLAKGYAAANRREINDSIVLRAQQSLAPDSPPCDEGKA